MTGSTLLTFTGFHDPFHREPGGGPEQPGPVLSLLAERQFNRVVLLSTPSTLEISLRTEDAIRQRHQGLTVDRYHLQLPDPTDYSAILAGLRELQPDLIDGNDSRFYIATASGTPQMHACWLLLAASGELPARLLQVRPPRFVTRDYPLVTETDLTAPEFPAVRTRTVRALAEIEGRQLDLATLCESAGIVGSSPGLLEAATRAVTLAQYDLPILIQGENGTGKELMARLIHLNSGRSGKEMVTVNCSAIPEELVESELFGHKEGAFTGAVKDNPGKFRMADRSTLFLDEIAELSDRAQAKILRALANQEIEPVGEGRSVKVDVRFVAATNRDLEARVREGKFREDLYFRIKGCSIQIPPLRHRREDIARLAVFFLDRFCRRYGREREFTVEALRRLLAYSWPGNVRELQNAVTAAAALASGRSITPEHLQLQDGSPDPSLPPLGPGFKVDIYLAQLRERIYRRALELAEGRQAEAARLLGISDAAVSKWVKNQFNKDVDE